MTTPKLAILGTGNIANFHAIAFKEAGFEITHCAARENSLRAKRFAETFNIPNVYSDPRDIIREADSWDAILVAVWPEDIHNYLDEILRTEKVCLVEKPVSTDLEFLEALIQKENSKLRVAYNRRFYSTIDYAKSFIQNSSPVICKVELPEMVNLDNDDRYRPVLLNSAHGIDLILYLFGDVTLVDHISLPSGGGNLCLLKSQRGDIITLVLNWNSPANFCITLEADKKRIEVRPFEIASEFEGMEVIEPTEDFPLRRYVPKKKSEISSFPTGADLTKPGFVGQAKEIADIIKGNMPQKSAGIMDAYKVQKLLHNILVG